MKRHPLFSNIQYYSTRKSYENTLSWVHLSEHEIRVCAGLSIEVVRTHTIVSAPFGA
jgi:hypothetical protein